MKGNQHLSTSHTLDYRALWSLEREYGLQVHPSVEETFDRWTYHFSYLVQQEALAVHSEANPFHITVLPRV